MEEVRHVDGYCTPDGDALTLVDDSTKDQSGTVAGLAVALTFVTLAFIAYVAITQGWVDLTPDKQKRMPDMETGSATGSKTLDKPRANSVYTVSKTELPVLPDAPANWYYTDASNAQQGPVSQAHLVKYVGSISDSAAQNVLVWDGAVCKDWTPVLDVPSLQKQIHFGSELPE